MALKIIFIDEDKAEWKVGQNFPWVIERIREIQADGDELEHIRDLFLNRGQYTIPMPFRTMKSVRWWGDIAKTIVANL